MPIKVTKEIGPGKEFALFNAFDNWLSAQNLVTQDIWIEALVYANQSAADVANTWMHPLTYSDTHFCLVKPAPGLGINEIDPTGALDYGTSGIQITAQANTSARIQVGNGVIMEGFRILITEATAPGTIGQYGIGLQRFADNSTTWPNTGVPATLRKCRILSQVSNSGNAAIINGSFGCAGQVIDNVFFQDTGSGAFVRSSSSVNRVERNTFVRRGTSTGAAIVNSSSLTPQFHNNAFHDCSGVPIVVGDANPAGITSNYTNTPLTTAHAGITYSAAALIESTTDARPTLTSILIGNASASADSTTDIRGNSRGGNPDAGGVQRNTAPPAATGTITAFEMDGQNISVDFTTTNSPDSGSATLTATGNGAVTQPSQACVLGSGVGSVDFTNVPSGSYLLVITLTNAGGNAVVSGQQAVVILGADGGGSFTVPTVIASGTSILPLQ